jgi:asparagine synthetase B (glutamine-hydrolysing)
VQITLVVGNGETRPPLDWPPSDGTTTESGLVRFNRIEVRFTPPASAREGLVSQGDAGLALIAGDPVHSGAEPLGARLQSLLTELAAVADDAAAARAAGQLVAGFRGVFVALLIPTRAHRVVIVGDPLGVRPVYQAGQAGHLSISTSMGLVSQSLPRRPDPDLVGVLQWSQSDTVWGSRTILKGVTRNRAAEIAVVGPDGKVSTHHYLDWTSPADATDQSLDGAAAAVLETFRDGVRLRSRSGEDPVAFLSGGMDSRLLVHALREHDLRVQSFGFAPLGSQDLLFAEQFAGAAGVAHRSVPRRP